MGELGAYRAVLASRWRAQLAYPLPFAVDVVGSLLTGGIEVAEVWIVFHNVTSLGGLSFGACLLVYALAATAFALADLIVGHVDSLPRYVREGTLDAFYLRPQPLLAQLVTSEMSLRRIARAAVGLGALGWGLSLVSIDWSLAKVLLVALSVLAGTAIFTAVFVLAAGCQFFLVNGAEMTNAFVYGGGYAAKQPASIFPRGLRLVFGWILPVSFVGYLPTLVLLDLPGPPLLPAWLAWCLPLAAGWTWLLALAMWRTGVRHYQGGGG